MPDLRIVLGEQEPDLAIEEGDLALDPGLLPACLVSLFVDRRADPADILPASEDDPRGWPLEPPADPWGSRLWLLDRAAASGASAALARAAALQGLRWLTEEQAAETVEVEASLQAGGQLHLDVEVSRGRARRHGDLWRDLEQGTAAAELGGATLRLLFR